MNCPDFATLMRYMDRELPDDTAKTVKKHLESCSRCRALVRSQERLEESWRNAYVPPGGSVFERMEEETFRRIGEGKSRRRFILPAAAGLIAVLLGLKLILLSGSVIPGRENVPPDAGPVPGAYRDGPAAETIPVEVEEKVRKEEAARARDGFSPVESEGGPAEELPALRGSGPSAYAAGNDGAGMLLSGATEAGEALLEEDKVSASPRLLSVDGISPVEPPGDLETGIASTMTIASRAADTVKLVFDPDGRPDSATAELLDSLVSGWDEYIGGEFSDTVFFVPVSELEDLFDGEPPPDRE